MFPSWCQVDRVFTFDKVFGPKAQQRSNTTKPLPQLSMKFLMVSTALSRFASYLLLGLCDWIRCLLDYLIPNEKSKCNGMDNKLVVDGANGLGGDCSGTGCRGTI